MPKVKNNVTSTDSPENINLNDDALVVKQKRGRKTKKQMEELKQNIKCLIEDVIKNDVIKNDVIKNDVLNDLVSNDFITENDSNINENNSNINNSNINENNSNINDFITENNSNINDFITENDFNIILNDESNVILNDELKSVIKKRGRKPKGGKIIQQVISPNINKETKSNIILHLKCSLKDLINNSTINTSIESFDFSSCKNDLTYEIIDKQEKPPKTEFDYIGNKNNNTTKNNKNNDDNEDDYEYDNNTINNTINNNNNNTNIKEIWKKLKQLEYNLHINNISNKKSYCFWCTCDFDNPPVYIPKYFIKDSYHVYGCFCSPECGTAFLMDENIDSSTKFERYHLLNHIYAKIYDYKNNIKPAPNPYYMLDKYYGNLNIQEYRALLNNQRLFLIVDKPLTRILPELHEDNDDFIINNKIIPSNTYQVKKNIQKKGQSKNNIVNEKFGLAQ